MLVKRSGDKCPDFFWVMVNVENSSIFKEFCGIKIKFHTIVYLN